MATNTCTEIKRSGSPTPNAIYRMSVEDQPRRLEERRKRIEKQKEEFARIRQEQQQNLPYRQDLRTKKWKRIDEWSNWPSVSCRSAAEVAKPKTTPVLEIRPSAMPKLTRPQKAPKYRPERKPQPISLQELVSMYGSDGVYRDISGVVVISTKPPSKQQKPAVGRTAFVTKDTFNDVVVQKPKVQWEYVNQPTPKVGKYVPPHRQSYTPPSRPKVYHKPAHQKTQGREWIYPHHEPHFQGTLRWKTQVVPLMTYHPNAKREQVNSVTSCFQKMRFAESEIVAEESMTKEENVTFHDERETIADQGMPAQVTQTAMQSSMQEQEWHIRNVMGKPLIFDSVEWNKTHGSSDVLGEWLVPGKLITGPHETLMKSFVFWRGHPQIRIQLNSTKFHFGRLMLVYIPRPPVGMNLDYNFSMEQLQSSPHVFLDAGISNSGLLKIPFTHMKDYFNIAKFDGENYLGTLRLYVFNALGATTAASTSVDLTLWVHYDNCELHQPIYEHTIYLPGYGDRSAEAGVEGLVKSLLPAVSNIMPGLTKTAGSVLGMSQNCDKPTDPQEIQRWVPNVVSSLNFGDGLDRSNRLSLQVGTYTIPQPDVVSTTEDDSNLKYILQIENRIFTQSWSTSRGIGSQLFSISVYPTRQIRENELNSSTAYVPTILAYITRAFKYWRGSLIYKIQVVASAMHSGRLMFAYAPGIIPSSFRLANTANTIVMDLQEKHEIEIVIPYMTEKKWLRCDKFIRSTGFDENRDLGMLQCYVQNRLTAPDGTAQEIYMNVNIKAGPDFEVAIPVDLSFCQGAGRSAESEETVTKRAEPIPAPSSSAGGGTISSPATATMGENAMDLSVITRRYTKVFEVSLVASHRSYIMFPNTPSLGSINTSQSNYHTNYRTLLAHFSQLFTFWSGSLRYKMIINHLTEGQQLTVRVFHIPAVFQEVLEAVAGNDLLDRLNGMCESYGVMIGHTQIQGSLEFEIPFYTDYNQLQVTAATNAGGEGYNVFNSTGTIVVVFHSPFKNTEFTLDVYQAGGDDLRWNYLRGAPILSFEKGMEAKRNIGKYDTTLYTDTPNIKVRDRNVVSEERHAEGVLDWLGVTPALKKVEEAAAGVSRVTNTVDRIASDISTRTGLGQEQDTEEDEEEPDESIPTVQELTLGALSSALTGLDLGPLKTTTGWFVTVANLISGFNSFVQTDSLLVKAAAIITIVSELLGSALDWVKSQLHSMVIKVLEFINECKQGNRHSEAGLTDFLTPLLATFACGGAILGFKHLPTDKETTEMVRGLNDKLRLFNGSSLAVMNMKKIWNEIKDTMDWLLDWILGKVAPHMLAQMKLEEGFHDIENWYNEVTTEYFSDYISMANSDPYYAARIERLYEQGQRYQRLILTAKAGSAGRGIREFIKQTIEMRTKVREAAEALPFRVDPFSICLYGESNLGKSTDVVRCLTRVMRELGYATQGEIVSVNWAEKFFTENYTGQKAMYGDDFSQFELPEQFQHFFTLKSNTALPLNMAFNKGKYFSSHFIATTTNVAYPQPNFLAQKDALWRRRDALIQVRKKTGQLDEPLTDSHEEREYRFLVPCPRSAANANLAYERHGPWMSYEQMQEELVERARRYLNNQQKVVYAALTDMGYIPKDLPHPLPQPINPDIVVAPDREIVDRADYAAHQWRDVTAEDHTAEVGPLQFDDEILREEDWDPEVKEEAKRIRKRMREAIAKQKMPFHVGEFILDRKKIQNHEVLSLFEDEGWMEAASFAFEEARKEWLLVVPQNLIDQREASFEQIREMGYDPMKELLTCTTPKSIGDHMYAIKQKIVEWQEVLRKWLIQCRGSIAEKFPWLKNVSTWPLKLAGAMCALVGAGYALRSAVHTCVCRSLRALGFRCIKCGRWPLLDDCKDKEWMQREWESIYGPNQQYQAGRITPIEEELDLADVLGCSRIEGITAGTADRYAQGVYSQNDRGSPRKQVVAASGPYHNNDRGTPRRAVVAEASQDLQQFIDNRVIPYTYRIKRSAKNGLAMVANNAVAIGGRTVIVPRHFFTDSMTEFEIYHGNSWMRIPFDAEQRTLIPNKDLVFYEMPIQFHQHRSMEPHFISETELPKLSTTSGYLARQSSTGVVFENLPTIRAIDHDRYSDAEGRQYYIRSGWSYPQASSWAGSCGSLLVTNSNRVQGKILGFHVAGGNGSGTSQLITRELVAKHLKGPKLGTPLAQTEGETTMNLEGHFSMVGRVSKERGVFQPTRTNIVKTAIHGMISPPTSEPAVLDPNDPRLIQPTNVMRKGLEKYGVTPISFNKRDLALVKEHMLERTENWTLPRRPCILTKEEAVLGCPEYEGYERLPMNTSPGYPYVLTRPRAEVGKAYLFNQETGEVTGPELERNLSARLALAQRGERCVSVWTACLKDERRPLAKIQAGVTRVFIIPPVDYSLVSRMYTMDYIAAVKQNRAISSCKLGIDPQSIEWTHLYNRHAEFSPYVLVGDFKQYDGTFHPDITKTWYEFVDDFYKRNGEWKQEDQNVRKVLCDESVHTQLITGHTVFLTHTGNKSGDPVTTPKNSDGNHMVMALAWLGLARRHSPKHATMAEFRRCVRMAEYGDDHLASVIREVLDWYNQETISEFLIDYGITYTNAKKTGTTKYEMLDEATFLKNGFASHQEISAVKVPIMAENTILELLNWTRHSPDPDELLESNCNDALRFAYFYGHAYFEDLRSKIRNALKIKGLRYDIMTYNDFHYWFLFTIGMVTMRDAESFFESVASSGNGKKMRFFCKLLEKAPYKLLSWMGFLAQEDNSEKTDTRYAIAIPSGEGKSWLCRHYPGVFVDHDELLLPAAHRLLRLHGLNVFALKEMFELEFPEDDRRILLTHHPDNTKRKILGSYVLPEPNFIRMNALMRLRMKDPKRLEREQRNNEILELAKQVEPSLFCKTVSVGTHGPKRG